MTKYVPRPTPLEGDPELILQYLARELQEISLQLSEIDGILLPVLHNEPEKPRNGMIVLADGTNWNPGSGAGYYGRSAGAWVFLG